MTASNIGRFACIEVEHEKLYGNVLDVVHGTDKPKRIRIQRGDPRWIGCVVQPHEYQFCWFVDDEEDP